MYIANQLHGIFAGPPVPGLIPDEDELVQTPQWQWHQATH